ncbi:MAG TPA: DUF2934 domain-containing protein [bacterium]|jgi:hypothetical protein|nr:DUF2934 domain-containing protein [bacterium]
MKELEIETTAPIPNVFPIDLKKQIEEAAYFKWIKRGLPPDSAEKDWIEAEDEIIDSLKETRI